jgi:poly-gamma-glutamate biosynthesis protein PgsC/CapC
MHEYFFAPEIARVALVVGVVISMLFYERVQLTTGGAIVPAYLALYLPAPLFVVTTLLAAYLTYVLVSLVLARRKILYGRRKFEIEVLVGLAFVVVLSAVGSRLGLLDPLLLGLSGIGFLVPGVLAHDMFRQKPTKTVVAVVGTSAVLGLFLYVYNSLISISPASVRDRDPVPLAQAEFPEHFLVYAVCMSVLIGMVVFASLGLRSGGFISGAYVAFLGPRSMDLAFALVVALLTWLVVVHVLMPRLLLFGRRKVSTMVLVGAVIAWSTELAVTAASGGRYIPWQGLTIVTFMVPALLANDFQRQGVEKTLWGFGLTSLGVYAGMSLLMAAAAGLGLG